MSKAKRYFLLAAPPLFFVIVAGLVLAGVTTAFDSWAYLEATKHMSPVLTALMKLITVSASTAVVVVVCLGLFVAPKSRRTAALPVVVAVLFATLFNLVLKNAFMRLRPEALPLVDETSYAFPSGHAMIGAALYISLALWAWRQLENRQLKVLLVAICVATTVAICLSRVYLGVHYATDVIAGWCLGVTVALASFLLDGRIRDKLE